MPSYNEKQENTSPIKGHSNSHPNLSTNDSLNSLKKTLESSGQFKKNNSTNLLKQTFKLGANAHSDPNLRPNPRTSMSQLKLYQLTDTGKSKEIERFDLEELRNGYFDPLYVKPENVISSSPDHNTDHTNKEGKKSSFKDSIITHLKKSFNEYKQHKIVLFKFFLAYFISIILCLIDKPGDWFGIYRVFLPISTLINHPVHSIGAQIEITALSIAGLALGLGWSSLALYISTATQPTRNRQGGIIAGSLFIGIFFMGWFKAYFIRFYYMFLASGFVLVFLSANLDLSTSTINWKDTWNIGIPYLFGLLVSLFVSLVVFPDVGHTKIMESILDSTKSIKDLIIAYKEAKEDDPNRHENLAKLQKQLTYKTLILSENFREYLSEIKLSVFNDEDLKRMRNHLNFAIGPLRAVPTSTNIYFNQKLDIVSSSDNTKVHTSQDVSGLGTAMVSGIATPLPRSTAPSNFLQNSQKDNKQFYKSIVNSSFNEPLYKLLSQMIVNLSTIESTLRKFGRLKDAPNDLTKEQALSELQDSAALLKKRVWQLDAAYRKFSKSDNFCRDLLSEVSVIDMFLFLRYSRQSATMLISFSDIIENSCKNVKGWRIYGYNYPWRRSLRRLPKQCLRDQGADSIFYYFETKLDVDDAFERIYNLNTSRLKNEAGQYQSSESHPLASNEEDEKTRTIRAIDHNDFNYHSTSNPLRYKLWKLSRRVADTETKYAFKVAFMITFLSLPGWLFESYEWYFEYNCFWAPLLAYFFLSPRNSGNWENLATRTISWFIGCFWGWAANQSHHFKNPIVIGAFSALICIPFSFGVLVKPHPRSSLVALMSFTIIGINTYTEASPDTADIFKNTWITSVAILISVISAILTNWLVWPFVAKTEFYKSCSSLLSHIAQSYQTVSERYLYRDEKDDPTELTLELANIREVRMSQSIYAIKELLLKANKEHDYHHSFKNETFEELLNSCEIIMEKIIEARISGVYFHVWEQDRDEKVTSALLSARRDSVATVIYLFYVLSNSFKMRSNVPKYLPSAITIRKRLYDLIGKLEQQKEEETVSEFNIAAQLEKRLTSLVSNQEDYGKSHWTEVHGMAFARAFTTITEELENIIKFSKEILGEETLF
ncbi:putative membrane protein [Wickerhamomyces ciferrii]|uniref:Membrane protein n=1 Tax=Wickerhamomyces ciferrii (strain ATCC 14091 / BCRC 22168 / CBS 111 / JCM 3599 / NBRC 0793 / NRRL Y-1031 F-60-10) TaxID=1206466 RepID=K0KA79_WICCF|nr:uncharacterized protein BN7_1379 [Wickerhamomyces ciferrii]CCH41840.1 putative membrane protein [Wickerhamomyces ciferrii]